MCLHLCAQAELKAPRLLGEVPGELRGHHRTAGERHRHRGADVDASAGCLGRHRAQRYGLWPASVNQIAENPRRFASRASAPTSLSCLPNPYVSKYTARQSPIRAHRRRLLTPSARDRNVADRDDDMVGDGRARVGATDAAVVNPDGSSWSLDELLARGRQLRAGSTNRARSTGARFLRSSLRFRLRSPCCSPAPGRQRPLAPLSPRSRSRSSRRACSIWSRP